ncbi:serine hydrolase-domain-containing protein [Chytriomyces sp. MP71]|nr:serine hydrolase-domain-containing protein [Chytriomyces sp. MP71]
MPRILMLHGYSQNDIVFRKRTAVLRKDLETLGMELGPLGWWLANAEKTAQIGYKESVHFLKNAWIEKGPFDGIIGFSQGAALAPLFVTELAFAATTGDMNSYILPKFMILVSGFVSIAVTALADAPIPEGELSANSGVLDLWPEGRVQIPALHVIGQGDAWVVPRESHGLVARFAEATSLVAEHEGGHYIPTNADMRVRFKEYVASQLAGTAPK